ncbi:MAG: DUF3352 domain-containing protein, partial [Chloroflexota bacterium]|nr:DUF3352 domain-containing protein [Chloroflexota bacterium]
MATDQEDENSFDERDGSTALDSPFRRLTPTGDPAWQSPPRPDPVDAYTVSPATITIPPEMPDEEIFARQTTAGGSRFNLVTVLGLVGGVILLTAVVGGAYFAYQALLGHEDRVTAGYAPADSWAYVAVNVDPTSRAWLDAWELAKRAGIDDELAQLPKDGLEDAGSDPTSWETLIRPAVGRELGFAVWPNHDGVDEEPFIAAIIMVADEEKAREALDELLDEDAPFETTYRDITYQTNDDDSAAGIVDEALILASSSAAFEEIVDARRGGALDKVTGFSTAASRAAANPLVFAYVNGDSIAEAAAAIQDEVVDASGVSLTAQALGGSVDIYADLGQITTTVKADGNALRTEVLTEGRPENFPMTPANSAFADQMPASTLFYVASADLYRTVWEPAMAQFEAMSGTTGGGGMPGMGMPGPDDIDEMLGFDLEDGLLAHLYGPYALSVNAEETGGEYGGQFHFFSKVTDPETVEDTLDDVVESFGGGLPIEPIDGGYRVDVPEEDLALELTVIDGVLHLSGSYRASAAGGTLASDPAFTAAMD